MSTAIAGQKKKHTGRNILIAVLVILLVAVLAVGALGYYFAIMVPKGVVETAKTYIEVGNYVDAYRLLKETKVPAVLGSEKLTEKQTGIGALKEELIAAHPTVTLYDAKVGDVVTYGHYEQDCNTENGAEAIEWIVLAINEESGRILVVSRYCLDCHEFDSSSSSWSNSSIREWLNKKDGKYAFYGNAFSEIEQSYIVKKSIEPSRNPQYYTGGGQKTNDKIFLLSVQEVEEYFADDAARVCEPTTYARKNGSYVPREGDYTTSCRWWLRTPGESAGQVIFVATDGSINYKGGAAEGSAGDGKYGGYSGQDKGSVRPAMWIEIEYPVD